jgi:hypothetical protein
MAMASRMAGKAISASFKRISGVVEPAEVAGERADQRAEHGVQRRPRRRR